MINDKLPDLHQPLAALIRNIAPDVTVELETTTADTVSVWCTFGGRGITVVRHDDDDGYWRAHGKVMETELDLLERLCWLVDAPRVAGPADIATMRAAEMGSIIEARLPEPSAFWETCRKAMSMDSAAILACSRALPNNDWRKHTS